MNKLRLKAVFTAVASERLNSPSYRRIGTAFVNADQSITVVLDAMPVSGRLLIRDVELAGVKNAQGAAVSAPRGTSSA